MGRVAPRFARVEPRRRARAFVEGLLAGLPRVNCWSIAEQVGDPSPDGMQHLLSRASWDHDGLAVDLRDYVAEHLGADDGVLVVDETGDVKKGTATVGVQRQYSGTAGRTENCQVGSTWSTPRSGATRSSTASCTCPGRGPTTRAGARPPGCPKMSSSPPNRRWHNR